MAGNQFLTVRMVIHDVLHINKLGAGIQLHLQPLRIIGHKAFLHAVKSLVQPDAVHMHFTKHGQVLKGDSQP